MDDLLQTAVRMKTHQIQAARPKYEASPKFKQASLFLERDLAIVRGLNAHDRLDAAGEMKARGNEHFEAGAHAEAARAYERAIACFHYFMPLKSSWRSDGFGDEDLCDVRFDGAGPEDTQRIHAFLVGCYLNLAQAHLAAKTNYADARHACDEALALDPRNAKALFRRARARTLPLSAGATDLQLALCDLRTAATVVPRDPAVRAELERLQRDVKIQRDKDRVAFAGFFDRAGDTPLYNATAEMAKHAPPRDDGALRSAVEHVARKYEAEGKVDEALRVREEWSNAEARAKGHVDWTQPSEAMVREARNNGVDLTDPKQVAYLQALEKQRQREDKPTASIAAPAVQVAPQQWRRRLAVGSSLAFIAVQLVQLASKVLGNLGR